MRLALERRTLRIGNETVQTMSKLSQDDADFLPKAAEGVLISNGPALRPTGDDNAAERSRARWPMAIIGFGLLATLVWAGVLVWLLGSLLMRL
jgi:hypothetical protein